MRLVARVKQDLVVARTAREADRVGALRMVLSELQKSEKEGGADELAVLRRERKRRLESAAAFREGGRDQTAEIEGPEAKLIGHYLPAEMPEGELRGIVRESIAETGATSPKDLGQVMKATMAKGRTRAGGKGVSALAREELGA